MARPFLVRVGDLLREPGSTRALDRSVPADDLGPLEITSARVIPGTDVTVVGVASGMAGGVEFTGTIGFDWWGACRRCLDDVDAHGQVQFREIAQPDPVDEDVFAIDGDVFDLQTLVRELVLANLPLAPLCGDDCPGPDPDRFPTTTEEAHEAARAAEAAAAEPARDPRWAALDGLQFDDP